MSCSLLSTFEREFRPFAIKSNTKYSFIFNSIAELYLLLHCLKLFIIFFLRFQIPITLHKETGIDAEGREVMKCGFKIGGGIDQDFRKSPQGYTDNVFHFRIMTC